MNQRRAGLATAVLLASLLAACSSHSYGWRSAPYVGKPPPPDQAGNSLRFVGLALRVELANQLRTIKTSQLLVDIPLSVDPSEVYLTPPPAGQTRVWLSVTPSSADWIFEPAAARLHLGALQIRARAGLWRDPSVLGARYEALPARQPLPASGQAYLLALDFPVELPSPRRADLAIELAPSLHAAGQAPLPLIRFAPVYWHDD